MRARAKVLDMRILVLAVALLAPVPAVAQAPAGPPPDCSAPAFHAFDFWIGNWDVAAGGGSAGTNRIDAVLDGCALVERWISAAGVAGQSFNVYDRRTDRWHQAWTDERGGVLWLTGGIVDGRMVMASEPLATPGGGSVVHRITWSREGEGLVRQLWESTADGGVTWTPSFDGRYTRRD
jgi:hypothetical protein